MLFTDPLYKYIIDLVMPNSCPFCGKLLIWDRLLCDDCEADMPEKFREELKIGNVDGAVGAFYYEDKIIGQIYSLKRGGNVNNFAELSSRIIAERLTEQGISDKIDIVTAVPMYLVKKLTRGRNQAELLAGFVADAISKRTDFSLLARRKDTTEQHKLEKAERLKHAEEVYAMNRKHTDISGKTVLICDDVITTGATIGVCAKVLKTAGAAEVYACSAAVSVIDKK
ncbi:MAG: ComF family protein [Ruminococcus albus]|nr:ComF family protein [Ruminococcus albus]